MKKTLILLLTLALSFSLFACGSQPAAPAESADSEGHGETGDTPSYIDVIKERGVLRMGTEAGYPPFEFIVMEDGKSTVRGMDVDIAQAIADELGVELEIVDMNFDSLVEAVVVGDVDMVLAGMNPSPKREKAVDFSKIYWADKQALLIRVEDEDVLTTVEDFDGKAIGAQLGTIQENLAEEAFPNSELLSLAKISDLVMELQAGNIDGIVVGYPTASGYASAHDDIMMSSIALQADSEDGTAVAIAKGHDDFLNLVNDVLTRLIDDGTLEQMVQENSALAGIEEE